MLKFRDKVKVLVGTKKIEGYVFSVQSGGSEYYVILEGQNTKPLLVQKEFVEPILEEQPVKRGRGRPRKQK